MVAEAIKKATTPFKLSIEQCFDKATPDQYRYLFGVVYKRVADHVGESVHKVHHDYMSYFNIEFHELENGNWELGRKSGSEFTKISIANYIEMIRADAIHELGVYIEDPGESW